MTSPDSSVPAVSPSPAGTEGTTCQSCGHDADLHSASWGCIAVDAVFVFGPHSCACMVPHLRILGDAV